jgi:5'-nucleotidase
MGDRRTLRRERRSAMRTVSALALAIGVALAPGAAPALDILLTNDDGYLNPGINTLRAALCAAGHEVTMVAPATNQSGRGGSLNTGVLSYASAMALTKQSSDACGAIWFLAAPTGPGTYGGTPVDSLRAGLNIVLAGDRPDLVVSGNNFGQNLGKPTSNGSGTVGAALQAAFEGIPAIATSVGLLTSESPTFPSTIAAFDPAAQFIVKLIATLQALPGSDLLPRHVKLLNVNFPVPLAANPDVQITRLADEAELDLPLFDRNAGFPPLLPGNPALPSCATLAVGESCSLGVGVVNVPGPDTEGHADADAFRAGAISITPMDGDMTSDGIGLIWAKIVFRRLLR